MLATVRVYAQPTIILISSRIDESVDAILDPDRHNRDTTDDQSKSAQFRSFQVLCNSTSNLGQFQLPYLLEARPSPEFKYESGAQKLIDLYTKLNHSNRAKFLIPGNEGHNEAYIHGVGPGFTTSQGNRLCLSTTVDLDSRLTVGCAGAVLTYLQRRRTAQYLPGDVNAERAFRILALEMFALDGVM